MATFFATFKPGSKNCDGYFEIHAPSNHQAWWSVDGLDVNAIHGWQTFQNIIDRYSKGLVGSRWVPYELGDEIKVTGHPRSGDFWASVNPRYEQTGTIIQVLEDGIKYEVDFSDTSESSTAIVAIDEISLVHEPLYLDETWIPDAIEKLELSFQYLAKEAAISQRNNDLDKAKSLAQKALKTAERLTVWTIAKYVWPNEVKITVPGENGTKIDDLVAKQLISDGILPEG